MKKSISLKLALAVLISMTAGFLYAETGWKIVSASKYSYNLYIAGFLDNLNGIAGGLQGEVHYTTDGGKTWPAANNKSWCRFGLEILDATNAWTCGNPGHVRVSYDDGKNWNEAANFGGSEPEQCRYLSFIDPLYGWIAAPKKLAVTSDGAKTWNEMKIPAGVNLIQAIDLLTKNQGYIFTSEGLLFITKDGGKKWSKLPVDLKGRNLFPEEMLPVVPIAAMRFQNDMQGTLVVMTVQPRFVLVLETSDGGKTWKDESLPDEVTGVNGSVYLSHDLKYLTISDFDNGKIYLLTK